MNNAAPKPPDTQSQPAHQHRALSAPGRFLGAAASWLPGSLVAGVVLTITGLLLALAACWAIDHWFIRLEGPGWVFLPVVALVGYRWGWRLGLLAALGEVLLDRK